MIVSINWLKEIIDFTLSPQELEDGLTSLGLECTYKKDSISYHGIVVGKILSVSEIEDSDHLNLCSVDIGESSKDIVCGASNVKPGILVPIAVPGSSLDNGKFKIKKAKIRGVVSNGMICSEKELGISDNHDGIMILDDSFILGSNFDISRDDDVLDIDLTPNRGDCFSHLGVAREIALLENKKINKTNKTMSRINSSANVEIQIADDMDCPRYAARVIRGVKVGPSPSWLKNKIESIGQKSINNIVDAANYILFDLGHPMHTFDLDKIKNSKIIVKRPSEDKKITCLDGVERTVTKEHLLICDDEKPLAIAGIMGLDNSSVKNDTKDVLIESAYFNPITIRKGAKLLDLSTDASKRFERDTDIESLIYSLDTLAGLIQEVAGGDVCDDLIDQYPNKFEIEKINFSIKDCNSLLGTTLDKSEILDILNRLSISTLESKNFIECTIPSYRNDLERPVDLYEEIARVFGYDNIPVSESFSSSYISMTPDRNIINKKIANILSMNGFNEHYSNSLLSDQQTSLYSNEMDVELDNPLSSDMRFLRNSILPGLAKAVEYNMNHGNRDFKLFEMGEVHKRINLKDGSKYVQSTLLGLSWCCLESKDWKNKDKFDFFEAKGDIDNIFQILGLDVFYNDNNNKVDIILNKKVIGFIVPPNRIDAKLLKTGADVYFAQISLDDMKNLYTNNKTKISLPSNFPNIERDISILVSKDYSYKLITDNIYDIGGTLLKGISLFDLYIDKKIDNDKHSLSISLCFSSPDRTLQDKDVDTLMDKIIKELKDKFEIIQR